MMKKPKLEYIHNEPMIYKYAGQLELYCYELEKKIKVLEKALDKACEELNEWCLSCCGIDEELHGSYPNFKTKDEWKEWCMKDV